MKTITTIIAMMFACQTLWAAKEKTTVVTSPDGTLKVTAVTNTEGMTWKVEQDGKNVILPSAINISIGGKKCISQAAKETARKNVDKTVNLFYAKRKQIREQYQTVTLAFANGVSVELRAYDDFAAYRILTDNGKRERVVDNETAEFRFADDYKAFVPYVNDNRGGERWCYSFESY